MNSCIFCKIIQKQIPAKPVFENESFIAIHDIQPQAKKHILIIPKSHHATLDDAEKAGDLSQISGDLFSVALTIAKSEGIESSGYRLVLNQRSEGGQSVFHLHMHLLGGEQLNTRFA